MKRKVLKAPFPFPFVRNKLTDNEQHVLYALIRYPELRDRELAEKMGLKHSTVIAIRRRLQENGYIRTVRLPLLHKFGCELLAVIYTNFNPGIPLAKRLKITEEKIEASEELFFSMGESEKGFSLSLSKDYTNIGRINDVRTETFGSLGLLEKDYPSEVIFPLAISKIYRFFDFSPLVKHYFSIRGDGGEAIPFETGDHADPSETEKAVLYGLVKYPQATDKYVGKKLHLSRHTVSRVRRQFEEQGYIQQMKLPDLKKIGLEIVAFYHIRYDPASPPDFGREQTRALLNDNVIFMATRQFETVVISAYRNYEEYKADKVEKMQFLKRQGWIAKTPLIRTYSLTKSVIIKDFTFAPITRKVLGLLPQ